MDIFAVLQTSSSNRIETWADKTSIEAVPYIEHSPGGELSDQAKRAIRSAYLDAGGHAVTVQTLSVDSIDRAVTAFRHSALKLFAPPDLQVLRDLVDTVHSQAAWRNAGRMFYLRSEAYREAMKTEAQSGVKYDYFLVS
jgi:hypothetical protein